MQVSCIVIFASLLSAQALIMPISKPDGSLDVTSLLSHITLLEKTIENKASVSDISKLERTVTKLESELQTARMEQKVTQTKLDTALEDLKDLSAKDNSMKTELAVLQSQIQSGNSQCTCGSSGNSGGQPAPDLSALRTDVSNLEYEVKELQSLTNQSDVSSLSSDVSTLMSEVKELQSLTNQSDVSNLSSDVSTLKSEVKQLQSFTNQTDVSHLSAYVSTIKTEMFQLQSLHNRTATSQGTLQGSSVYTRWGRTSCPSGNNMVYYGYAAGSFWSGKGGSASMLCLPEHPVYSNRTFNDHDDFTSLIYGTEYYGGLSEMPFRSLVQEDMPCAVCESNRATSIMVPARDACYQGWTREYSGFLMGGEQDQSSADYICVDTDAEAIPGGNETKYGRLLYPVASKCGVLVCPPYVDGRVVTCVLCSK